MNCQSSLRLKWGCTKYLCCHFFLLAVEGDVVTRLAREISSELLNADDLVLMSETVKGIGS